MTTSPSDPLDPSPWPQHSRERPRPRVVIPGPFSFVAPPSDAVTLFAGKHLLAWRATGLATGPPRWRVHDGFAEVAPGTGAMATRETFGDVQLHLDWSAPLPTTSDPLNGGHSGVLLMGAYEIRILDSHRNDGVADGLAGSLFGQFPPLVNPTRAPGEWNSFDLIFFRPRFDADGKVTVPALATLLFNGVLVQSARAFLGPTSFGRRAPYQAHKERMPIVLEEHNYKVRFRNIWVRRLE